MPVVAGILFAISLLGGLFIPGSHPNPDNVKNWHTVLAEVRNVSGDKVDLHFQALVPGIGTYNHRPELEARYPLAAAVLQANASALEIQNWDVTVTDKGYAENPGAHMLVQWGLDGRGNACVKILDDMRS